MSPRERIVIGCAATVIFVLAAAIEIDRRLSERDESIRSITEYVKAQRAEAEQLRRLGRNTFTPESHAAIGESSLEQLKDDPRPIVQGLFRAFIDLCVLLPVGLATCYLAAAVVRHPSRRRIRTIVIRLGLPVLCVAIVLFLLWMVLVAIAIGPLAVPAG